MAPLFVEVEMPGGSVQRFSRLVLDYTGTLSLDGILLPGVAERLNGLAANLRVIILTADTFRAANEQFKTLPVEVHVVQSGVEKARLVLETGGDGVIAIGNGRNDVLMMERAGLAIGVVGPEGCAGELLRVAHVVARDIQDALDLVENPLRLKATLRD